MQLELELTDRPPMDHALWEGLDPALRETLIDKLALVLAKVVVPPAANKEADDE